MYHTHMVREIMNVNTDYPSEKVNLIPSATTMMVWGGWSISGCPDVKHKENESTGCCTDCATFDFDLWPWIFKLSNCISGMGGPIAIMVMERKRQESIGCLIVMERKGQELIGSWTLTSPMTLTLDFCLIFNVGQFLKNGRPNWHGTKRTGGNELLHPLSDDTVRDWGDLVCRHLRPLV